jgi:hypothetical protein
VSLKEVSDLVYLTKTNRTVTGSVVETKYKNNEGLILDYIESDHGFTINDKYEVYTGYKFIKPDTAVWDDGTKGAADLKEVTAYKWYSKQSSGGGIM